MHRDLCFCGHDCARCVTRVATIRHDDALRAQAQAFYHDVFGLCVSLQALCCYGGRSQAVFCLARECPFAACCRKKGIHSCRDCADYPCAPLSDYQQKYVNRCNQIVPDAQDGA